MDIKKIINRDLNNTNAIKLQTIPAYEVSQEVGTPVQGGEIIDIKIYSNYLIMQYPQTLAKVKYSNNLANINIVGVVDDNIAIVPVGSSFIKIYFIKDNQSTSKVFDIIIL